MKMNLPAIKNYWFYAGLTKEEYSSLSDIIQKKNRSILVRTGFLAGLIMAFLFSITFLLSDTQIIHNRITYCVFFFLFFICFLAGCQVGGNRRITYVLIYALMGLAFLFGTIIGAVLRPEVSSTAFCVMLVAVPFAITDSPARISALLLAAETVFATAACICETSDVLTTDLINSACFMIIGMVIGYVAPHAKLKAEIALKYAEAARDTDSFTGFFTKPAAQELIGHFLAGQTSGAALVITDIDNFKSVNDTYGHVCGDRVLGTISEIIRASFPEDAIKSRFGGDEIIIFIPNVSSKKQISAILDTFMERIRNELPESYSCAPLTCSCGVSTFPDDADTYLGLLEAADKALYNAKRNGKNQYCFYFA